MTITLAGGGSPTALSATKRRYCSTAVGFPIRIDLRGYSQRVSGVFPSWVGARCACTYVYAHGIAFELSESRQHQCSRSTCNLPASTAYTPIRRPQFSYLAGTIALAKSLCSPRIVLACWLAFACERHPSSRGRARLLPWSSFGSLMYQSCLLSWFACGSLLVHLGVTCSRLILVPYTFNAHSWFIHGSLIVGATLHPIHLVTYQTSIQNLMNTVFLILLICVGLVCERWTRKWNK